jgi:hypothetical protein
MRPADHFDIVGGIELSHHVTAEQISGSLKYKHSLKKGTAYYEPT